jgi:hypothetical protein
MNFSLHPEKKDHELSHSVRKTLKQKNAISVSKVQRIQINMWFLLFVLNMKTEKLKL